MRRTFLMALASTAILSGGIIAGRVAAMPAPIAAAPGIAIAHAGLFRVAAVVCGGNGCAPVQTKVHGRRKFQTLGHG
jgi:hypothetical protein